MESGICPVKNCGKCCMSTPQDYWKEGTDEKAIREKIKELPNKNGGCAMLTDDKICLIWKELGANFMPLGCQRYPREKEFAECEEFRNQTKQKEREKFLNQLQIV